MSTGDGFGFELYLREKKSWIKVEAPDEPEFVGTVQDLDDQPEELLDNDPRVKNTMDFFKRDPVQPPERTPESDAESLSELQNLIEEINMPGMPRSDGGNFQYPVKKPPYKAQMTLLTPITNRKGDRLDIIDMTDGSKWLILTGEDDSFMMHQDGKLDKVQRGSDLDVQLNNIRNSMTIPQERLDQAEEEQIMQMVSLIPGVDTSEHTAGTYMQLDSSYIEADADLVAKVNQELGDMMDSGLPEIDCKHAVFTKYGPGVYNSIFKKTSE